MMLFVMFSGCNYKPLYNTDSLDQPKFKSVETDGNKRIAQLIVNKLSIVKDEKGTLSLYLSASKNTSVSNKSSSGKVLEYSINLIYQVEVRNYSDNRLIYSKKIDNSENYKPSSTYSDTVSNEKKIIENISRLVARQIVNEINLALRNDI